MNQCEGCELASSDCMKNRPQCGKDIVFCDECGAGIVWDKLTDEEVHTHKEYHGQPNLRPEIVVNAWVCPECGHYNRI